MWGYKIYNQLWIVFVVVVQICIDEEISTECILKHVLSKAFGFDDFRSNYILALFFL